MYVCIYMPHLIPMLMQPGKAHILWAPHIINLKLQKHKLFFKFHHFKFKMMSLKLGQLMITKGFPGGSEVKASACNVGDLGLIPGSGRSSGEGNGNPLQYSCLKNPMGGGAR